MVNDTPRPLYPRESGPYLLYRRLGGSQGRSGRLRKISPPPGFNSQTVQCVASRYTELPGPQLSLHNYKIGDPVLLENGRVFHVIKPRRKSSCENLLNFRNISEHRKDYPLTTACHESLNIQFLRSGSKAVCPMSQICGT